ncbi:hypothetical protein DUNSADRAFT_364 [Dunaliella salina]|uniref:Encoded protein n=1 Tax=Dunaliella salina TaxID=3046 RepID=A0ABQ7FZ13_DUNSA|nr:hypothetical protein DUNSADRAFT_364 [Dunaliella salina]|eukprot:KAF5827597.1 hypothetical protein DUNSADRAFT_364 [Dunaliella salina]
MSGHKDKDHAQRKERLLAVERAELNSLKPGRAVYLKRGGLFYLSSKEAALERVQDSTPQASSNRSSTSRASRSQESPQVIQALLI